MNTRQMGMIVLLACVEVSVGCAGGGSSGQPVPVRGHELELSRGYSLLYSTLSDESQVDKVLILKDPNPPVEELLKAIGAFSSEGKLKLEGFSKQDATLDLKNEGLPEIESATRKLISSATSKQVLFSGGKNFEFRILLTQHEALNYIHFLATALSEKDKTQPRKVFVLELATKAKALHERVIMQLESAYVGPEK